MTKESYCKAVLLGIEQYESGPHASGGLHCFSITSHVLRSPDQSACKMAEHINYSHSASHRFLFQVSFIIVLCTCLHC